MLYLNNRLLLLLYNKSLSLLLHLGCQALWSLLHRFDAHAPAALMRLIAFRMLVVIERA